MKMFTEEENFHPKENKTKSMTSQKESAKITSWIAILGRHDISILINHINILFRFKHIHTNQIYKNIIYMQYTKVCI